MGSGLVSVIDVGTTSVKLFVYDDELNVVHSEAVEVGLVHPGPGRAEQDAERLYVVVRSFARKAGELGARELGITTYRASIVLWRADGSPLTNVVTWMDSRGEEVVRGFPPHLKLLSKLPPLGAVLSASSPAVLVRWFLDRKPELHKMLASGEAYVGTVDSYLIYRLTGNYCSDATNATLTGLVHPKDFKPIGATFALLGLPRVMPEVKDTIDEYGEVDGLKLSVAIADQQAAAVGEGCLAAGAGKVTHGTGSFVDVTVGGEFKMAGEGLIPIVVLKVGKRAVYGVEGFVPATGAMVDWFVREGFFESHGEISRLAQEVEDSGGVVVVPASAGLRLPALPHGAGAICGLSLGAERGHLARAVLEGIAFSVFEIVKSIERLTGIRVESLNVNGGLAKSDALAKITADLLGVPVRRQRDLEVTARGAALLLLVARGALSLEEIPDRVSAELVADPEPSSELLSSYERWRKYVEGLSRLKVR